MGIFKNICSNCKEQFSKKKIKPTGLCEGCSSHALFLLSIYNRNFNELSQMIDNSINLDEIISKYNSLCDFALQELKPWYRYNCVPQFSKENIIALEKEIYHKIVGHINFLINNSINDSSE